jgi:hypothetical protein
MVASWMTKAGYDTASPLQKLEVERIGIEPVTSGLRSRAEGDDARRRTTTDARLGRMATGVEPIGA